MYNNIKGGEQQFELRPQNFVPLRALSHGGMIISLSVAVNYPILSRNDPTDNDYDVCSAQLFQTSQLEAALSDFQQCQSLLPANDPRQQIVQQWIDEIETELGLE